MTYTHALREGENEEEREYSINKSEREDWEAEISRRALVYATEKQEASWVMRNGQDQTGRKTDKEIDSQGWWWEQKRETIRVEEALVRIFSNYSSTVLLLLLRHHHHQHHLQQDQQQQQQQHQDRREKTGRHRESFEAGHTQTRQWFKSEEEDY